MFAPFSDLVESDAAVQAQLGNPVRVFSFGEAPPKTNARYGEPYTVWQVVGGQPENYLAGRPNSDTHQVQVDTYGTPAKVKLAVTALVRAIELSGYVVSWNGEFRDDDTKLFRISFTAEFITPRT